MGFVYVPMELRAAEATSPVILGERNDMALLGAVTLESLGLVLNPLERTLAPMSRLLLCMTATSSAASAESWRNL
jgi:hypothetical protein